MSYYQRLCRARQDAANAFFKQNPLYSRIIDSVREVLPEVVLSIEKIGVMEYTRSLMSSFVRTAFVSLDLIISSDLVEAATLNRKQIELLARLRELDALTLDKLTKKTPNLKYLKTKLARLYSPYSESAHSSTYGALSLLGLYEGRTRERHLLYPEFTENTEIIFQNWLFIFFEFTLWVLDFKSVKLAGYSREEDERVFQEIHDLYEQSGLETKFAGKHGN